MSSKRGSELKTVKVVKRKKTEGNKSIQRQRDKSEQGTGEETRSGRIGTA